MSQTSAAFRVALLVTGALTILGTGCSRNAKETSGNIASARIARLSFNDQIQPILSENCYLCHGTDSGSRKGDLRLDRPEGALAPFSPRKGGPAIVKGDPEHSPFVQRLLSQDPEVRMPPPASHKTLQPGQIALLTRWVKEGAAYEPHWAFVAPVRPAEPVVENQAWSRNAIDRFVLARLEQERLAPSREADPAALLRRVTYDLTGLPPTPEEVTAFLADAAPDAYERAVDRLLASPRYGEHRARYWLDYVRYADTYGAHYDNYRNIWPYRDYVIRAFNTNKPFDQFTREQLAGDLLPARNLDQQIATAFPRACVSTGEGGVIDEEVRVQIQRDRVEAFGAVYLGLTTGCAACHDHKFDPLSQKDHYQLTAFFNNIPEYPTNDNKSNWAPFIHLPKPGDRPRYDALLSKHADVQAALATRRTRAAGLIPAWLASNTAPRAVDPAGLQLRLRFDEGKGNTYTNSAPHAAFASVASTGGTPHWGEDTWLWPSYRMDTTTRLEIPRIGDVERTDGFSVSTWFMPRIGTSASDRVKPGSLLGRMDTTHGLRGWDLVYDDRKLSFRLIHDLEKNRLEVTIEEPVFDRQRWNHVLVTYDGSSRASGVRIYLDGQPQPLKVISDTLDQTIRTEAPFTVGSIYPDARPVRQSRFQDLRYYARTLRDDEARRLAYEDYVAELTTRAPKTWNEDEAHAVTDFYFTQRDPESLQLAAGLPALQEQLEALTKDGPTCLISVERPQLAYADVLNRGGYADRRERVRPATPHFLPPMAAGAPLDRSGLAEWVVAPGNPLTARVTVNRMWAELFGTGIVETTDDFGVIGARPSHQLLLDWLAVEFRESGWDMKHLYRLLVTSATYRQSAVTTPDLLEKDPHNRLLARGPRYRLDAEELRDGALAASGLLVDQAGGPPVKPYQPTGVWEAGGYPNSDTTKYVADTGASLYRRSVYTFWKRMAPMADMEILDAPTRDISCTRRQRTNSPGQALVTMNDPQWLEASRRLAENLLAELPDDTARLERLGLLTLARPWHPSEQAILARQLAKFRATYATDPAAAATLVRIGDSPLRPDLQPIDVAAWMLVANTALNLDATLNK